jgi:archaellum biogenesis protein FlaJ (TadC family)
MLLTETMDTTNTGGSMFLLLIELAFFLVWIIVIPVIIGKKVNNVALKCTILIFFNWIFAVYYFIKAVTEKD